MQDIDLGERNSDVGKFPIMLAAKRKASPMDGNADL